MLARIHNARCRIGRQRLLCIDDFSIAAGQHWCLFGANGAGKSLLANLLLGRRRESGSYVEYAENFDPGHDCLPVSFEEQQRLWQRDNRLDISDYNEDASDVGTTVAALIRSARYRHQQHQPTFEALLRQLDLLALGLAKP